MSKQLATRSFLVFIFPVLTSIAIIAGIVSTIGVEDFGKMLLDRNPIALSIVARAFNAKPVIAIKEKGSKWILKFMGDIDR